jgi:hypothetical protein
MDEYGRASRKSAVGQGAGDPVRDEPTAALEAPKRNRGRGRESAVDLAVRQPEAAQSELQHGNIPSHGPYDELALPEERSPTRAEGAPRTRPEGADRLDPSRPLERDERSRCGRPQLSVDRPRIEAVPAKPHL